MALLSSVDSNVQAILKTYYAARCVDLTYKNRPLLTMLPKATDGGGDYYVQPVTIGEPAGTSSTFAKAKANTSNVVRKKFTIDWREKFTVTQVNNTNIDLCRNDKRAIVKYITGEVDKSWDAHSNKLESALFASGYGEVGQIATSSGISGSTITLQDRATHVNFYPGQKLVLSSALSTAGLRNAGATVTVSGVNRQTGVITCTAGIVASIAAAANGDYIFIEGDRQDSATPALLDPAGLAGWFPLTAPTAGDNFFGVDRSVDPDRLAGARVDGRGLTITEAINNTLARVAEFESMPDIIVMHHVNFTKLLKETQNKLVYTDYNGRNVNAIVRGVDLPAPNGTIKVVSAARCQTDRMYTLTSDTMKVVTVGEMVRNPLQTGEMMDLENSDGAEIRHKTIWAIACEAPGRNAVTQLA